MELCSIFFSLITIYVQKEVLNKIYELNYKVNTENIDKNSIIYHLEGVSDLSYTANGINIINLVFLIIMTIYVFTNCKQINLKYAVPIIIILFVPIYFDIKLGGMSSGGYIFYGWILPTIIHFIVK